MTTPQLTTASLTGRPSPPTSAPSTPSTRRTPRTTTPPAAIVRRVFMLHALVVFVPWLTRASSYTKPKKQVCGGGGVGMRKPTLTAGR